MRTLLPRVGRKYGTALAFGTALAIACMLFILIPLTQTMPEVKEEKIVFREVNTSSMPPPPSAPPTSEVRMEDRRVELENVSMDPNPGGPKSVTIQSLELSLSPGTGDAVAMGGPLAKIETGVSLIGGLGDGSPGEGFSHIFEFKDLRESPRILYVPTIRYPESLIRRRITEGEVVMLIEIDQEGRATVEQVVSSTRPELEAVAMDAIRRARFTIPKIDGRPVRVRGRLPLTLHAPN